VTARGAAALALAAAVLAGPARGQPATVLGPGAGEDGDVLGLACVDRDGDGACGAGDPGLAFARVLSEGGEVAVADAAGRFHLAGVPARRLLQDRTAGGLHALALEGIPGVRVLSLGPAGGARVVFAVPAPPGAPPPLDLPPGPGGPPARDGEALRWPLAARTAPGVRARVNGAPAEVGAGGELRAEVPLLPGENPITVEVEGQGGLAAYRTGRFLARRREGGDLVLPAPVERVLALAVSPARGGGSIVLATLPPGHALHAGARSPEVRGGAVALLLAPGEGADLEVRGPSGAVARARVEPGRASGLAAVAALADVEVLLGGGEALVLARGAGAARGRAGPVAFEAGVDLDDRDRFDQDLLRPRDPGAAALAPDPARGLLETGDAGTAAARNPARGRLWGRAALDGPEGPAGPPAAVLEVGPVRTGGAPGPEAAAAALREPELGRHDRALLGARLDAAGALGPVRARAAAFGATLRETAAGAAPPVPRHDVLDATGGSVYWLSRGELVRGSEAVRVEWRDPATGLLAGARALARGVDYEVEWESGRLLLARPLPSSSGAPLAATAEPSGAPAARLVVDYLAAAAGQGREDAGGGAAAVAAGPVEVSARVERESGDAGPWDLAACAVRLDLGAPLAVRAEVARSEGAPFARGGPGFSRSADGGLSFAPAAPPASGAAQAWHAEAEGGAGPLRGRGWWREREAGFVDGSFAEALDARERGAEATLRAGRLGATLRWAERRGADPLDPSGLARRDVREAAGRLTLRVGALDLAADVRDEEADRPAGEGASTAAGLGAGLSLAPGLRVEVSHHQALRVDGEALDPTFSAAAVEVDRGPIRGGLRAGWGPDLGPRAVLHAERRAPGEAVYGTFTQGAAGPGLAPASAALGVRRRAGEAEAFTEDVVAEDAAGARASRVAGATVALARGLLVTVSGERGARRRPDGTTRERTGGGATASLVRGALRLSLRGEGRREGAGPDAAEEVLLGAAAGWGRGPGSLTLRGLFTRGDLAGREALGVEVAAGLALRLGGVDLALTVERTADRRPGEARRDAVRARLVGGADVVRRLRLGAGLALALRETAGVRDEVATGSVRAEARVLGPLDLAAEYARRAPLGGGTAGEADALRAEAGLRAGTARLGVGYALVGFAGDGTQEAEDTSRLYLSLRVTP
jgi:hypothetical protein